MNNLFSLSIKNFSISKGSNSKTLDLVYLGVPGVFKAAGISLTIFFSLISSSANSLPT
jgi:hypothetical protein